MSSATWSFVDLSTGEFTGRCFSGPVNDLMANTPSSCMAVIGRWDPTLWFYDRGAQCVVAREASVQPVFAELQARLERDTLIRMAAADQLQQRIVRELLLALATGTSAPTDAVARLSGIEAEMAEMRTRLAAIRNATGHDQLPG